jgi:transcription antitermination factor NusG
MVTTMLESFPRWFAVCTASRHEKHVSAQLQHRQIESFLPLYRTVHRWKNRSQAALELPLFPSYVFVRIPSSRKGTVLAVPGVLSMVGSRREAWPLPDSEIEALRSGLDQRKPEPHPYLVVGDRVRIVSSALAGMEGVLVRRKNALRVVLTLDQLMRSVSVEIGVHELEPVCAKTPLAS